MTLLASMPRRAFLVVQWSRRGHTLDRIARGCSDFGFHLVETFLRTTTLTGHANPILRRRSNRYGHEPSHRSQRAAAVSGHGAVPGPARRSAQDQRLLPRRRE